MKRLFFVLIFALSVGLVRAEMHTFKLPDGRSIVAEIVDVNARQGIVELRLENGSVKKIKPSIFVQEDQDYISAWSELAGFRSPAFFKISCKRKLDEKWDEEESGKISYSDGSVEDETISETKYEKFIYEILLENRNKVPLQDLTLEYRIFYEQGTGDATGTKLVVAKKNVAGKLEVARLDSKAKTTLKSSPVVIHDKDWNGDYTYKGGDPVSESGEVKGIWLRVQTKGVDGKPVIRDVYEPESIAGKYAW
ncbi:hypothetical protein P4B35_08425 [Pontiellaceae bacterium B12227]|nr:hypothetical protein [Pontiellaceae bacterium B12227]